MSITKVTVEITSKKKKNDRKYFGLATVARTISIANATRQNAVSVQKYLSMDDPPTNYLTSSPNNA